MHRKVYLAEDAYKEDNRIFNFIYSKSCLNRTFLGPTFAFGIDRCVVNTDYIYKDIWTLFKVPFIRISLYSKFGLDRFHCTYFVNLPRVGKYRIKHCIRLIRKDMHVFTECSTMVLLCQNYKSTGKLIPTWISWRLLSSFRLKACILFSEYVAI